MHTANLTYTHAYTHAHCNRLASLEFKHVNICNRHFHLHTFSMEKLDKILAGHVARGSDTKNKVLGAAFTVVNADGKRPSPSFHFATEIYKKNKNPKYKC